MTHLYSPKLAPALREVARRYFDNDPLHCGALGICANAERAADGDLHRWDLQALFARLGMAELNPFFPELGDYCPKAYEWEPRAYMALLLAEIIEQSREGS